MSARYTKDGLLIPTKWLKPLGDKLRVQRSNRVVIIESTEREAARKRLVRMTGALRKSAAKLGRPSGKEMEKLVKEVRKKRAGGN